jgi:hypothetical protein
MAQFAARLLSRIRHKPASGNDAHMRAWARKATNAVEDAFIYACAMHAGTSLVAVTQKRAGVAGPLARIASVGTIQDVRSYLTPPNTPVVPKGPLVLAVGCVSQSCNLTLGMSMPVSRDGGWKDSVPWPEQNGDWCDVTGVTSQTQFAITRASGSAGLPTGVTAPSLMLWNESTSTFESLDVQSVTAAGGDVFNVVLNTAPAMTIATGQIVSPDTERRTLIAQTLEDYFDGLGPGEVLDLATDTRAHRAYRFPEPGEEYQQRAGSLVLSDLHDALGGTLSASAVEVIANEAPAVPTSPTTGPTLVVLGKIGIYPNLS